MNAMNPANALNVNSSDQAWLASALEALGALRGMTGSVFYAAAHILETAWGELMRQFDLAMKGAELLLVDDDDEMGLVLLTIVRRMTTVAP